MGRILKTYEKAIQSKSIIKYLKTGIAIDKQTIDMYNAEGGARVSLIEKMKAEIKIAHSEQIIRQIKKMEWVYTFFTDK